MHPRKTDWLRKPQRDPKVLEIPLEMPGKQKVGELRVDHYVFSKPNPTARRMGHVMNAMMFGGFEPEPPWNEITVFGAKHLVDDGFHITRILKGKTLWMTDAPQERYMMEVAARQVEGDVLVGGCGLGMYPQYCLHYNKVSSITIVEIDPDIIEIARQSEWANDPRVTLVQGDISAELQRLAGEKRRFDTVYLDTHDKISPDYIPYLNTLRDMSWPLLNKARAKGPGHIYVWAHKKMVEQAKKDAKKSLENVDYHGFRDQEHRDEFDKRFPIEALLLREIESRGYRPKIGTYGTGVIQKREGWSTTTLTSKELDAFYWNLRVKDIVIPLPQTGAELKLAA
jgi:hypothetical protein